MRPARYFITLTICMGLVSSLIPRQICRHSANTVPCIGTRYSYASSLIARSSVGEIKYGEIKFPDVVSEEWELDCYSRPVTGDDGKKLWEVVITDSTGSFRYIKSLPSNLVNSRTLRKVVEEVMESSPVRPRIIRFFRNQMFNMITIALTPLDVDVKPSRQTHNLFMWLAERERDVYPLMPGYNPQLRSQTIFDYDVGQPERLPDVLKAESYAFTALPAAVFWNEEVNNENINRGKLCPLGDLPKEGWVQGITLFSKRSESIAAWMSGLELGHVRADLIGRELILETDITTQFIIAPLLDAQKKEAQIFEKSKTAMNGYHFISVQAEPDAEDVKGFWLLRKFRDSL
eukprot:CAMPEP_0182428122 /NCGR_PEP_ID=MMETSP1167-20130531/21040_1 /TAXON_ID=2988 /ORGANISM="Mallomonas Sp, Strain CCMP3275" /LENGTH=345 /DNA_ID=CAMNT_0024610811 /DNA_START=104 /DNA_END=1141 /DNA_ORIENTATION=+